MKIRLRIRIVEISAAFIGKAIRLKGHSRRLFLSNGCKTQTGTSETRDLSAYAVLTDLAPQRTNFNTCNLGKAPFELIELVEIYIFFFLTGINYQSILRLSLLLFHQLKFTLRNTSSWVSGKPGDSSVFLQANHKYRN